MKSMLDVNEGWMAERGYGTRVYHYIREGMALCRGLAFYRAEMIPDTGAPKGNADCAKCFRILRGQTQAQKLAAKPAAKEPAPEPCDVCGVDVGKAQHLDDCPRDGPKEEA